MRARARRRVLVPTSRRTREGRLTPAPHPCLQRHLCSPLHQLVLVQTQARAPALLAGCQEEQPHTPRNYPPALFWHPRSSLGVLPHLRRQPLPVPVHRSARQRIRRPVLESATQYQRRPLTLQPIVRTRFCLPCFLRTRLREQSEPRRRAGALWCSVFRLHNHNRYEYYLAL